jgi:hypothetical protein
MLQPLMDPEAEHPTPHDTAEHGLHGLNIDPNQ